MYKNFIKTINDCNFLDLKDDAINNEIEDEIPIVSTLRVFFNNKLFCITFHKIIKCDGFCKYKNETKEECITLPYLNIDENKLNNERNQSIQNLIFKDILKKAQKYVRKEKILP